MTLIDKTLEKQEADDNHLAEKMSYLSVLASNVAHQLNNPLSSMLNRIGVLLLDDFETVDTNSLQEELRKLQDQIYSMSIVTVALQSFSEIDRSAFKLFDVNAIVEKSIQLSKLVPRVADIEYKIQIKRSLPLVLGSEITFEQCLINILKNALEAMPQGGMLRVTTGIDPYESTMIRIVIQDSGSGIPDDHKERIFEPFFTTKDTSHPGLGLTVSYGIVTSHQGRISISSPKNKGTRVTILMPVAEHFKRTP
jgi:signal transduction histidine kinase